MEKFIEIEFNGKIYKISKEKVNLLIEKLENCNPLAKTVSSCKKPYNTEEIKELFEKFELNEDYFLENINNI